MAYPNFKNKHLEKELFSAIDYVSKYKKYKGKLPKKYIFIYNNSALNYFKKKYKPKKIKIYSYLTVYNYRDTGLIKMAGIGAPHAVAIFEEVIALGGKQFINIGTAGGLHHEGIFICEKALRDEGTSYHYISHGAFSYPDKMLTKKLEKAMKKHKLKYFKGTTWTIDAPYRETIKEIEYYSKKGISLVEMEASALFAVAKVRKVKIASAFVVSDILKRRWKPKFQTKIISTSLNKLIDAAVSCLRQK